MMRAAQISSMLAMVMTLASCHTCKQPAQIITNDSVRVESHVEHIIQHDTVMYELPPQVSERVTKDSTSVLENDFAISTASVDAYGFLHHSLRTRQNKVAVPVEKETIRKDSIIYKDSVIQIPTTDKQKLTNWQKTQILGFWVILSIAVIAVIYRFRKGYSS